MPRAISAFSIRWNNHISSSASRSVLERIFAFAIVLALPLLFSQITQAQTLTVLYNFPSGSVGSGPAAGLTLHHGKFYGTSGGGTNGHGAIFELSPDGSGGWKETTLYSFTGGLDGSDPDRSYVIFDREGNLYGTTVFGGQYGRGVVFQLKPVGKHWTETVLHSFRGRYSSYPSNGLVMDSAGNLYGTTNNCCSGAGKDGAGVFELIRSGDTWTEKMIFTYPSAGFSGLAIDPHGNLYGFAYINYPETSVFRLSPRNGGGWTKTILYNLAIGQGGLSLNGSPALDKSGNLYGVTEYTNPGQSYGGTVFELSPANGGQWTYKLLHSFTGGTTDGSNPVGGPVLDHQGNIYGTTQQGGAYGEGQGGTGLGTVFELVADGGGNYTEKLLWSFNGTDGGASYGSLVVDSGGNLYGTSVSGGANGNVQRLRSDSLKMAPVPVIWG